MNNKWRNYTKLASSQFVCQSSISSSINYFKIDNQSITTLFQGEVKYINLTNYHFLRVLDLFRFDKYAIIIFMVPQSVWVSQDSTQ